MTVNEAFFNISYSQSNSYHIEESVKGDAINVFYNGEWLSYVPSRSSDLRHTLRYKVIR